MPRSARKRPGGLAASAALAAGLIAVVLVALPAKTFELDRYFVPKELVLHVVALTGFAGLLLRARPLARDAADTLLACFVAWSALSSVFATNLWLAQRALGLTVSSTVVFWMARQLGAQGRHRAVLLAAAAATVCAAATSLAQAYGLTSDYFSLNRAPGGTFGNRNFVAHVCAIGLPVLAFITSTSRRLGAWLGSAGVVVVGAALVLTRSRGAWLALALAAVVIAIALVASRAVWRGTDVARRGRRVGFAMAAGAVLALVLPNHLNWTSDSPYLDSAVGIVDYKTGSGRGRLEQYERSIAMAFASPVLGVGPGNWPVRYVRFAKRGDPSLASDGMTANPWPSSDWIAFVSERGFPAVAVLLAAFAWIFVHALSGWARMRDAEAVLASIMVAGTIAATLVVSAFDAVLLLGAPALLVWTIIGAGSGVDLTVRDVSVRRGVRAAAAVAIGGLVVVAAARSAAQVVAVQKVGRGASSAGWLAAAAWDPGSYRINLRAASAAADRRDCVSARRFGRRALALSPDAPAPKGLLRSCN
jgi:O-antigen ligase